MAVSKSKDLTSILSTPQPPVTLQRLNARCSLYTPAISSTSAASTDPTTILLPLWMDSSPKHAQKYLSIYAALYPSARILVAAITTTDFFLSSTATRTKLLQPLLTALASENERPDGKLLVHLFSNGGNQTLYNVATAWRKKTGNALPVKLLVADSAPGAPHFWMDVHALTRSAPSNPVLLALVYIVVIIAESVSLVLYHTTPFLRDLSRGPREAMVDPKLVQKDARMLFLYSKEDEVILWKDVETQAKLAGENGYEVETEIFKGSKHVSHARNDPESYWAHIVKSWEVASGA
jgi:hypothetical protein